MVASPLQVQGPACCEGGVRGYGNPLAKVMFVGIAPGRDEWERSKRPLTGPSGQLLDALLAACHTGLTRDDVYTTNLICWWEDEPSTDAMDTCAGRLAREVANIGAKLLVPLGALACERLTGLKLARARGAVMPVPSVAQPSDLQYIMATYHPAAALHEDPLHPQQQIDIACNLVRDFKKISAILDGTYDKWQQPTYTLVGSCDQIQGVLSNLPTGTLVTVDIETNYDKETEKYSPFDHEILSVSVSSSINHSWVIPRSVLPSVVWPTHLRYGWHHGQFDTIELRRKFGYWLPINEDSMLGSYTLDERKGVHRLKPSNREYTGGDFYEETEHKTEGPALYEYNGKDTAHTYRQLDRQRPLIAAQGMSSYYETMLIPAANMMAESQFYGIHVDMDRAKRAGQEVGIEGVILERELQEQARTLGWQEREDINVGSWQQLGSLLYDTMHLRAPLNITRHLKNPRSTDKNVLAALNHPFCEGVLRSRTLTKAGSTYILAPLRQVKYDGRIHPQPHLHGTVTGRLTYTEPAIQTLPKEKSGDTLSRIRRMYTASTPDRFIMEADYAQIEAKVGCHYSGDSQLHADLYGPTEWHTATAQGMFNVLATQYDLTQQPQLQEWKHYRDSAKHVNYGSMYMEGANGLTRVPPIGLGCSIIEARDYIDKWKRRYPTFVAWQQQEIRSAWQTGHIQDPWGHKRRFPLKVNNHQDRQAGNARIQMTSGHYTLWAALKLRWALAELDTYLLFIEHDALYYEGPKKYLKEVAQLVKQVMEEPPLPPPCTLPGITVDIVVGDDLYSMEAYHV